MLYTVKQARLMANMTQQDMASALGVHKQTYAKLEQNPMHAEIVQAYKISEITKIPYDQIFFGITLPKVDLCKTS